MKNDGAVLHRLDGNGASIEFSDRGEGEPVLLLHAGVFAAWFPALVEQPRLSGFRLVTPVRAGYDAARPAPTRHLTLADHARHAAAVLDELGIARAHIFGHSAGSLIGLQLAVDHPGRVASLVLVEPAAAPSLLPPTVPRGLRGPVDAIAATAAAGDLDKAFDGFMRLVCAADYREVLLAALGPDGLRHAERNCGFFFRDETTAVHEWALTAPDARRITQPVVFVQGSNSSPVMHEVVAGLAAALPNATTATIDGGDHLLPLRNPAALAAVAADFLTKHPITANA